METKCEKGELNRAIEILIVIFKLYLRINYSNNYNNNVLSHLIVNYLIINIRKIK